MAIIDASVYVSLVNAGEQAYTSSWAWFEDTRSKGEVIIAPVIMLAEVASALSRGTGDPKLANQIVQQLRDSILIDLLPVTKDLATTAAGIAADQRIRGCDAIYVAVAKQTDNELVTLDKQQLNRAGSIIRVRTP